PSDLRLHRGDEAVRELFTRKVPLFEFALRQAVSRFDLNSVAGRVAALREAAPIVAQIKDPALRPGYTRELARMLGSDLPEVQRAVAAATTAVRTQPPQQQRGGTEHHGPDSTPEHLQPAGPQIGLSSLRNLPT